MKYEKKIVCDSWVGVYMYLWCCIRGTILGMVYSMLRLSWWNLLVDLNHFVVEVVAQPFFPVWEGATFQNFQTDVIHEYI